MANFYDICEQEDALLELSATERGALWEAVILYRRGTLPGNELPRSCRPVFAMIRAGIDSANAHRANISRVRTQAIRSRWIIEKNTNEFDSIEKKRKVKNVPPPSSPCITPPVSPLRGNTAPPDGGASEVSLGKNSDREAGKREIRVRMAWIRRCIRRFYHRKASTVWADSEERKLAEIARSPDSLRECRELFAFYRSGYEYTRKSVSVLLNNWQGELDRARSERKEAKSKGGRFDGAF